MKHIVLLGDSIFGNKSYVRGGLDVVAHLRRQLPDNWKATLRAVDGNVVENVQTQILDLPDDATHLFISAGGNNALFKHRCFADRSFIKRGSFRQTCGFGKRI